jgi:hypothetical protein
MMDVAHYTVGFALALGTLRALVLWRAQTRVEVVNVVVLGALGEGRGHELPNVLRRSGSALYLDVAARIVDPVDKLFDGDRKALEKRLERDSMRALAEANARLRRHGWMDALVLTAIALTGLAALSGESPGIVLTGELLAATLLWLANVRAARSIATRLHAGAMTLVESLMAGAEQFRECHGPATRLAEN